MHIYYYEKNGFYYVMNEFGILEKYTVTNNIEMILKQENIIHFFTKELNKECNQFRFKTIEELNILEATNIGQLITMISVFEYTIFKENTFPILVIEASIVNIINELYKNRKHKLQKGDILLEDILKDVLEELNENLEFLKQISHYQKETIPLSELNYTIPKTYINTKSEIETYRDDIDIELDLNRNPENIFNNTEYDKLIEIGYEDKKELDFQWKIKKIKEMFLEEEPVNVKTKLNLSKLESDMQAIYLSANCSMSIAMILEMIKNTSEINELKPIINVAISLTILYNLISYTAYHKVKKYKQNTDDPILKLKKDK